jgi:CBS domain-containing protein
VVRESRTGQDAGIHGWSRSVGDVMQTSVVAVDRATSYKEIVRLLAEHQISGMPVLKMGRDESGRRGRKGRVPANGAGTMSPKGWKEARK